LRSFAGGPGKFKNSFKRDERPTSDPNRQKTSGVIFAKKDKQDQQNQKGCRFKEGNGRKALIFEHGTPPPKWTSNGPENRNRRSGWQIPPGTVLQDFCEANTLFS
jgi:hypothetical protein